MFKLLTISLAMSAFSSAAAAAPAFACTDHFPNNKPPKVDPAFTELRALCFDEMAILHSGETKTAVYSVQRVSRATVAATGNVNREGNNFYPEARLPAAHRATPGDYKGSGYDRGHLTPAGMQHTENSMAQSFSMANIVPQNSKFNRGTWKQVESAVKSHAARTDTPLHIYTGPMYLEQNAPVIGNGVHVPSHMFKVVIDPKTNKGHGWVMPNDGTTRMAKPIPVEQVSNITGIEFE